MESTRPTGHRLRIFLRDFRMVEAFVGLAEKQSLTSFFTSRKNYLNLRQAKWAGAGHVIDHMVLRVDQVLWATALDGEVPLMSASLHAEPRAVEFHAEGGLLIRGGVMLGRQQRLSDYLESAGPFIPVHGALLLRSGRPPKEVNVTLGGIVLNATGVLAVSESAVPLTGGESSTAVAATGTAHGEP
jgi:hypothetical protein